eukprot:g15636.t2
MREEFQRLCAAGYSEDEAAHCQDQVKVLGAVPRKWWCVQCDTFRPKRAHHCKTCRACVLEMDHHCPWVNNCVGVQNHKYFILFVGYAWLASGSQECLKPKTRLQGDKGWFLERKRHGRNFGIEHQCTIEVAVLGSPRNCASWSCRASEWQEVMVQPELPLQMMEQQTQVIDMVQQLALEWEAARATCDKADAGTQPKSWPDVAGVYHPNWATNWNSRSLTDDLRGLL